MYKTSIFCTSFGFLSNGFNRFCFLCRFGVVRKRWLNPRFFFNGVILLMRKIYLFTWNAFDLPANGLWPNFLIKNKRFLQNLNRLKNGLKTWTSFMLIENAQNARWMKQQLFSTLIVYFVGIFWFSLGFWTKYVFFVFVNGKIRLNSFELRWWSIRKRWNQSMYPDW